MSIKSIQKVLPLSGLCWLLSLSPLMAQVGQSPWNFSVAKPNSITFNDMHFLNNTDGLAVGNSGGIAKTTDGGATWKHGVFLFVDYLGQKNKTVLNDVHYVDATTAYMCGNTGLLAKSTDGGVNWTLVNTPFYSTGKNINTLWFTSKDTGFIGGQAVMGTTAAPKLYFTYNGGNSWDSIAAPLGEFTRIGLVNNPTYPAKWVNIHPVGKEIFRIVMVNNKLGYITGSGSNTAPYTNSTGGTSNSAAVSAGLLWKFENGSLTDYSLGKEKLGYSGYPTTTITASTQYSATTLPQQNYRSLAIMSDSLVVVASQNNGIIVRVRTGKNDSTASMQGSGIYFKGRYEAVQYAFPPTQTIPGPAPVVPPSTITNSGMYQMSKANNGLIVIPSGQGSICISRDSGATWKTSSIIPASSIFASTAFYASDILKNGKIVISGTDGYITDSIPGAASWTTTYKSPRPGMGINRMEFADCDRAVAVGGFGSIITTSDAGANWTDKTIPSLAASLISMYGMYFPSPDKLYFATSSGAVYFSSDMATNNDLLFTSPVPTVNYAMAGFGNRVWVSGWRGSEPTNKMVVFRSMDGGLNWDTAKAFPTAANAPLCQGLKFASADTGYLSGSKGKVYRTTDAGLTWVDVSPFPASNLTTTYNSIGIVDRNTIYVASFTGKKVYKTSDAGATWTDVSITITDEFIGSVSDIQMHDANNGYLISNGGKILVTTNGGTTWTASNAPSGAIFTSGQFVPKTVPAGTAMSSRRLFVAGTGTQVFEYGDPAVLNLSSSEVAVTASCTNPTAGTITVTAKGAVAPYTYSIDGVNFQSSNVFTNLTKGTKTVYVKEASCGRIITKTVEVPFNDNMNLIGSNDTAVCAGAVIPLFASSNGTGATYAWLPTSGLGNAASASTSATISSNINYTVTANLNGCVRSKTIKITNRPNPQVSAGPDKTVLQGDGVQLEGSSTSSVTSVSWTPAATLTGANSFTPLAKPTATTTYTITVKDVNNCSASDNTVVNFIPYCVNVMEAFTPNGDGINDQWKVSTVNSACALRISVMVFNRYGSQVYRNDNYQNDWNGTWNGKSVADGTYYYKATYNLINGTSVEQKGSVTILR